MKANLDELRIKNSLNEPDRTKFLEILKGYHRYEKLRRFNVQQFYTIFKLNIDEGYNFDDLVDSYPELPNK